MNIELQPWTDILAGTFWYTDGEPWLALDVVVGFVPSLVLVDKCIYAK